ncbi:hypothetical protein LN378_35030, partial [Enterobacter hormaechei subsp. steigerwaltii]|nr:hypothetical protein [Enterobacter hormaechei subsp. steigerwaltii]
MVTLATAFLGVWLVLASDNTARSGKRLLPIILIAALLAAGYTARQTDFTRPDGSRSTVALLQGNIDQTLKWREDQVIPTIQKYYE